MNLFSSNDFKVLRDALMNGKETYLIRTLRDTTVSARTYRVGPPWDVDMILQIQMERGSISWIQNFKTVDTAKEYMDSWEARFHWIS